MTDPRLLEPSYEYNKEWYDKQRARGIILPEMRSTNPDLLIGWKQISDFLSMTMWKIRGMKPQLIETGAVWFTRKGTPPKRVVCAFKQVLMKWITLKAQKGEII